MKSTYALLTPIVFVLLLDLFCFFQLRWKAATIVLQLPKALSTISGLPTHFWIAKSKQCPKQLNLAEPVELNAATKLLPLSVVVTTNLSVESCQFVTISAIDSLIFAPENNRSDAIDVGGGARYRLAICDSCGKRCLFSFHHR